MSDLEQLLAALPIDQLSSSLGEQPDSIIQAATVALPALLGGMQANAQDPAGALSLLDALTQHDNSLSDDPSDLSQIDVSQGEKIASHVFGDNQDQVINQLGATSGVSGGLIRKLLPILAPIVLSLLAKKMRSGGTSSSSATGSGSSTGSGGDLLSSVLEQVLKGATQGAGGSSSTNAGSIISDVLGGLLGGGRR